MESETQKESEKVEAEPCGRLKRSPAQEEALRLAREAKRKGPPPAVPAPEGVEGILRDMWHVYLNNRRWDKTTGEKAQRRFLDKDPKGFNTQFEEFRKQHKAALRGVEVAEGPEERDEGVEKALAAAERFLEQMGGGSDE